MKKFSKIFGRIVTILTIICVIICLGIIGPKLIGINPYIATSGSMEPTIETGSLVYINTNDTNIDINDIIMFKIDSNKEKDKLVTHRIIEKQGDQYITKGDANQDKDLNPIMKTQIVGKYAYHIPKIGFIYDKIGQKGMIIAAIWILLLNSISIILSYISKNKTEKNNGCNS